MSALEFAPVTGICSCRGVRFRMTRSPIFVHCCHCTWCQRETGSAFVLNAMVEAEHVECLAGSPIVVATPSASGRGQKITRCPTCYVALWSNYPGGGDAIRFVRVGTLEQPHQLSPDIHIYTSTRQPWVVLPPSARIVPEFYDPKQEWPAESLARYKAARERQRPS
jgi:hypothetical protein